MAQRALFVGETSYDDSSFLGLTESAQAKLKMERTMLMRYGEIRREDKGVPELCDCSARVAIGTSNTEMGKKYFSCPYEVSDGPGRGCGFRRWWTEALLDEFAKIKEEKKEMQKRLEQAHNYIIDHELQIIELQKHYEELLQDRKQLDDYDGEVFENGMALAQLTDKYNALERRLEAMEKVNDTVKNHV